MVGGVRRQLGLPGIQQFAAKQGDQGHGQQDQAEGQALSGGGQRVPQQLAESQPPWQAGTRQCPAQAVQAEQQEGAEHQRGDQAAAEQGEGQLQVETQPPHDQAQGEQGAGVGHPGAHRHRQQVAAQDPQRRYPAQGSQRRQGEAGQRYQTGGDPGEGGNRPPAGTSGGSSVASRRNRPSCANQPSRAPMALASRPSSNSCSA